MALIDAVNVAVAVELAVRVLVVAALAYAVVVGLTHWAVQNRRLQPFGAFPRTVRRISDPVLEPIERRLVRRGRNPQDAPLWLFGLVVVAGLLLITLVRWLIATIWRLAHLSDLGAEALIVTLVGWAFGLMIIALIVRVVSSWFGVSPYASWMRPVVALTEWLLAPIRRRMPPLGMVDLSPLVAYLILVLLRWLVMGLLQAVL